MLQWGPAYKPTQVTFHDWACLLDMPFHLLNDYLHNPYLTINIYIYYIRYELYS